MKVRDLVKTSKVTGRRQENGSALSEWQSRLDELNGLILVLWSLVGMAVNIETFPTVQESQMSVTRLGNGHFTALICVCDV